ncbi:hypothetical protein ABEB36_014866 [Hypothenemus hampei]|uniref:ATP-dependent RNA helicase n=1 Tax=Hypothenemus hampei TaxID=57062 RepID=A0ABD1E158_HYPHA
MTSFEFKWTKTKKSYTSKDSGTKKTKILKEKEPRDKNDPKEVKKKSSKLQNKTEVTFSKIKTTDNQSFIRRKRKKEKTKVLQNERNVQSELVKGHSMQHSMFSEKYKNIHVNTKIRGASVVEKVFSAGKKFNDLPLHKYLISNLEKNNFNILTNVQEKSIPSVLQGKNCLIKSQTGSGKTLTYAVPILNSLVNKTPKLQRTDGIQAIIVVPTRELALQTHELFGKINTFQWIIVGHLCGGENRKTEKDKLRRGLHILIGTPGRLLDHILHTSAFNGKNISCLVLDEADRLLDMGFKKDVVRLVEELDRFKTNSSYDPLALLKGKKPEEVETDLANVDINRQTLLVSATLSKGVAELADFTMKDHVYIDAFDESETINPDHMVIPNTVKQEFILTFIKHRLVTLSVLLISKAKCSNSKTIVFMATTQMVDFHYDLFSHYLLKMPKNKGKLKVGDVLLLDEIDIEDFEGEDQVLDIELFKLHGNMSQQERKTVFSDFRKTKKGILICTDVAARGIDVPEADCIIQYTGPQSDEDYLHRVGRTGRAGKSGSAIIFLTHEEQDYITRLQEQKVFLKEYDKSILTNNLKDFMEETDENKATVLLQKRFESALLKDKELHKKACFAYSSWSRFYSAFPVKMKPIFDLKKINIGHYVTSFGLQDSPTIVAKIVRGQAKKVDPKHLNKKLANHEDNVELRTKRPKRPIKSLSLTTSEYSSGFEPAKKKKKKNFND